MKIENQEENQRNIEVLRHELERTETNISVFKTMLYKHGLIGQMRFPPLVIQGFNIVEFEKRMMRADWMHRFSDDYNADVRGAREIKKLRDDIKLLSKDPEGSRIAFYLCERWIPENTYGFPDSLKKDGSKDVLHNAVQLDNYVDLIKTIKSHELRHEGLNLMLEQAERYQNIHFPSLIINGIDIAELEKGLIEAKHFGRVESYIGEYSTTWRRFKPLFEELETLSRTETGRNLASIYWSIYGREVYLGKAFKAADENYAIGKEYSDYFDFNSKNLKNIEMDVREVNVKEEDVHRLSEALKFAGLKEVPREIVVKVLAENLDKSVAKWDSKEDDISSNVDMHFKKSNGNQYLNGYAATFSKEGKQFCRRYNRIEFGNTLTYKQLLNMAQGRGIGRDWYEKDENGKVGERYFAGAMLDFADKDSYGNPKIVQYRDFDPTALIARHPFEFAETERAKENFMSSVLRGNLTDCALSTETGSVALQVYMNARENELIFKRPGGKEVDVTIEGNVAAVKDRDLGNEKKNDISEDKKTGQRTGTRRSSTNKKGPEDKSTAKPRSRKLRAGG